MRTSMIPMLVLCELMLPRIIVAQEETSSAQTEIAKLHEPDKNVLCLGLKGTP